MRTVRQIMSADFWTIPGDASLLEAETGFITTGAAEFYVVDSARQLLGVLPDYEVLKARMLDGPQELLVRERMFPVTRVLTPTSNLMEAATLLRMHIHRRVPVIDGGRVCGVVTRTGILAALSTDDVNEAIPAPLFLRLQQRTNQAAPAAN